MTGQYPYALYLDSKIIGAARQLVTFFTDGIFEPDNTIVYLKKYKESAKIYVKIFENAGITYKFMKPSELDALEGQTIFYAFNAQSNCRFVANRKLKHIFITHGESNKIASIKPIIRIYDHVVMAGKLSLERYYKSGLFDEHDYETGRLIMMGDTFIGHTGFSPDSTKENVLFYAPTWEGGLESENYSSLVNIGLVENYIKKALRVFDLNRITIQAHPNLGHRNKVYLRNLFKLVQSLLKQGIYVYVNYTVFNVFQRAYLKAKGAKPIRLKDCYPKYAFVDISAMEIQCINEKITYQVFYLPEMLRLDMPDFFYKKYRSVGINLRSSHVESDLVLENYNENGIIHFSDENIANISKTQRIDLMLKGVKK